MKSQFTTALAKIAKSGAKLSYLTLFAFVLVGCQTTGKSSVAVGPSIGGPSAKALGSKKRQYHYNSEIFLDVAIPVFDPGLPKSDDELVEKGIWPQLRRAEASRFALMTKRALEKTRSFGTVSVVPTPQSTADLYILGRIDHSDSEEIKITIEVADISGRRWDKKTFQHTVSRGFFRDKQNKQKDPYEPVFDQIADHIYQLLINKKEQEKINIKQISDIRFAQSFAPEAFAPNTTTDRNGYVHLNSLPSLEDPMYQRVAALRVQDQLFVDRLQTQYEGFALKTDESYHLWQKETLPVVVAARESRNQSIVNGLIGGAAVLIAAINSDGDLSTKSKVLNTAAALGGAYLIKQSMDRNAETKVHQATINEMGESLDVEMDPQVISLQDETVELTGTAQQQYEQWQAHLKRIYALEQTPTKQL
jgi:hypothetical protein